MADSLLNKSIVITGGSTGIGHATAQRAADEGALITIADVNDEAGNALVAAINKALKCIEARQVIPRSVFEDAQKSLDALPLPTAAYARYLCNIRNAESYVLRTEFGAARFELQMLLKSL